MQILEEILDKPRKWIADRLEINENTVGVKCIKTMFTFILIDFGWLFFRVSGMRQFREAITSIFSDRNPWILFDGSLYGLGLQEKQFRFLLLSIAVLMLIDIFKLLKISLLQELLRQHLFIRNMVYVGLIMTVLIFGRWGGGYDENAFLYFQF